MLVDNYLALTMAGRGQTLHALLGLFPPDAELDDGNIAGALAIDAILHGALDEAVTHHDAARRLAATMPAERRRLLRCVPGRDRHRARTQARRPRRSRGRDARPAGGTRRHGRGDRAPGERGIPGARARQPRDRRAVGRACRRGTRAPRRRRSLSARRIARPFIEIGCLANLAIAAPLTGEPLPVALELSERAVAIAEEHGWTSESMASGAFAMAGMALVQTGSLRRGRAASRSR